MRSVTKVPRRRGFAIANQSGARSSSDLNEEPSQVSGGAIHDDVVRASVWARRWFQPFFLAVLIASISIHLVIESAASFADFASIDQPLVFAILVESSIVGLSVFRPARLLPWVCSRLLLLLSVAFSIAVTSLPALQDAHALQAKATDQLSVQSELKETLARKEAEVVRLRESGALAAMRRASSDVDALKEQWRTLTLSGTIHESSLINAIITLIGRTLLVLCNCYFAILASSQLFKGETRGRSSVREAALQ